MTTSGTGQCYACKAPAAAGYTLCERHLKSHREAEQRRQMRAVETGQCLRCSGPIEPWRLQDEKCTCARCGRRRSQSGGRRCPRCGARGHSEAVCYEPPYEYEGPLPGGARQAHVPLDEPAREALREQLAGVEAEIGRMEARARRLRYELAAGVQIVTAPCAGPQRGGVESDAETSARTTPARVDRKAS